MRLRFFGLLIPIILATGCVTRMIDHMTGEDQANEIRKIGVSATARIVKIWDTGVTVNENPVVGMRLRVLPADGDPFEAETRALIGRLEVPQVQPGAEVMVKYDPKDRSRVALDREDAP